MYAVYGSGNVFTADVETVDPTYATSTPVTQFTFSGTKGYKFLECTGFGVSAGVFLVQGDAIQFSDSTGTIHKFIVDYATDGQGTTKSRIYLNGALPESVSASSVVRLRPTINNSATSSLIFPTGSKEVSSLISTTEDTKIKYYTRRDFVTTGSSSGGTITFAAQLDFGPQRFVEFNEKDFVVVRKYNIDYTTKGTKGEDYSFSIDTSIHLHKSDFKGKNTPFNILEADIEDIDLNLEDFIQKVNSDLVGKVVNIASRCAKFVSLV